MMNTTAAASAKSRRMRMVSLICSLTGAKAEQAILVNESIVVSGHPTQMAIVANHFSNVLGVAGVTVDAPADDDPEWTFCRIPLDAMSTRLRNLEAS